MQYAADWRNFCGFLGLHVPDDEQVPSMAAWQVMESMLQSIVFLCISPNGTIVEYNHAFAELAGLAGDMRGAPISGVFGERTSVLYFLQRTIADQINFRSRLLSFERDQHAVHLLVDARSVVEDGVVKGWVLMGRAIDDPIFLEREIVRNDRMATVGKFAAGIAHEIRNPLTSMKGFVQMLHSGFMHQEMHKEQAYAELVMAEIDHVNQLVDELLLLSRPRPICAAILSVNDLVNQVAGAIRSDATARGISLHVHTEIVPNIAADPELLQQALLNLTANALDAMDDGGALTLSTEFDAGMDMVRIDVVDTGPGIPHYLVDRIFDVFYTTKETGVGLGLPICQRIITDLGGKIRVVAKGFGAMFSVFLPPTFGE